MNFFNNTAAQGGGVAVAKLAATIEGLQGLNNANGSVVFIGNKAVFSDTPLLPGCSYPVDGSGAGGALYIDLSQSNSSVLPLVEEIAAGLDIFNSQVFCSKATLHRIGSNMATSWTSVLVQYAPSWPGGYSARAVYNRRAAAARAICGKSAVQVQATVANQPLPETFAVMFCGGFVSVPNGILPGPIGAPVSLQFQPYQIPASSVFTASFVLETCPNGYGFENDICTPCAPGYYSLGDATCHLCPADSVCEGAQQLLVSSGYWPKVSNYSIEPIQCPYQFCITNTSTTLYSNAQALCDPTAHRNGSTPLCGHCLPGYIEWDHSCVPCNGPGDWSASSLAFVLFRMWVIVIAQRILAHVAVFEHSLQDAQEEYAKTTVVTTPTLIDRILARVPGGGSGFTALVFTYQIASLAVYPTTPFSDLTNVFGLPPAITNLLEDRSHCPFYTTPVGTIIIGIMIPLVYFVFMWVLYLFHRAAAFIITRPALLPSRSVGMKMVRC